MRTSEKPSLQLDATDEEDPVFTSQKPSELLRNFKLAIGLLLATCTIVTVLMHLLVRGL